MPTQQLTYVRAISRWRVDYGVTDAGLTCMSLPVVSRTDNGPFAGSVTETIQIDSHKFEAVLSAPLVPGLEYSLSLCSDSLVFGFDVSGKFVSDSVVVRDPEAEAFGVDLDWLSDSMLPNGDLPDIRGRDCMVQDLISIARTSPGELVHRPLEGVGLDQKVNGPSSLSGDIRAALKRQWLSDARVKDVGVTITTNSSGETDIEAQVKSIPLPDVPVLVKI